MRIVLASKSPRRKEILENLGVKFETVTRDTDETSDIKDPHGLVRELSARKGKAVLDSLTLSGETLVIAADTVVAVRSGDGYEILGKPKDAEDAGRMLRMLSGGSHEVVSGIYLIYFDGKELRYASASESTEVLFDKMSEEEIGRYIASGEPFDKAGAYAIQGHASPYISGIRGDYFNVVGLPTYRLCKTAKDEFGINLIT